MREPQRLERFYHGHLIVSVQAIELHPAGDGWGHEVFDKADQSCGVFDSLGAAIQCAKHPVKTNSEPEAEIEEILPDPEPDTNTPETEENE